MSKLPKLYNFLKNKMKVLGIKRLVFLLLSLTQCVHTGLMTKKCVRNEDCGEDYICNEGICHNCFDCALLFRRGPSCIVDFKQCGSCLAGYKDSPVTDFSTVIKPCEQIERQIFSHECLSDHHCPFDNYCHEKLCIKCFDCSLYNRHSPTQNCAKEPQDCSSCLNGFNEVPVTTEKNTKPCEKITFDLSDDVKWELLSNPSYTLLLLFFGTCYAGILVFIVYKRSQGKSKKVIQAQCPSPGPPPYPSDTFQYVRKPEPEVEEESSFFTFVEEEKQQLNTAKVFRLPHAPYYESQDNIENFLENHSEDEEEHIDSHGVEHGIQSQNNIPPGSNSTNTDVVTPPPEVDDFEVINEQEINMATVNDVAITDSTSADVTHGTEECTVTSEGSKNPIEREKLGQRHRTI